jgi:hypothetical protein
MTSKKISKAKRQIGDQTTKGGVNRNNDLRAIHKQR